jgi:class 3 adenylate cyclase
MHFYHLLYFIFLWYWVLPPTLKSQSLQDSSSDAFIVWDFNERLDQDTTKELQISLLHDFLQLNASGLEEYTIARNYYVLDYQINRKKDYVNQAIVRYAFGRYLFQRSLFFPSLEFLQEIEDQPNWLEPEILRFKAQNNFFLLNYDQVLALAEKVQIMPNVPDSTQWYLAKFKAMSFHEKGMLNEEITTWEQAEILAQRLDARQPLIETLHKLALAYRDAEKYDLAIATLNRVHDFHQQLNPNDVKLYRYYVDIALVFKEMGNTHRSIAYLEKSAREMRKNEIYWAEALIHVFMASLYRSNKKWKQARSYGIDALKTGQNLERLDIQREALFELALIEEDQKAYASSLKYLKQYLEVIQLEQAQKKVDLEKEWIAQYEVERVEKEFTIALADQEMSEFEIRQLRLETDKQLAELELVRQQQAAIEIQAQNNKLRAIEAEQKFQLLQSKNKAIAQENEIQNLKKDQRISQLIIQDQKNKEKQDSIAIEVLQKDKEIAILNAEKQRRIKNRARWIGALSFLLAVVLFWGLRSEIKNRKEIARNRDIIRIEKQKSENLLLNILPKETADELKAKGKAKPRYYEEVSILFTDISGFTRLTEKMKPEEILDRLEGLFTVFDEILEEHQMERIKTIGDGYMCASGLPISNTRNADHAVEAGLRFLQEVERENRSLVAKGESPWNIRIGINTGPVVAGVIGKKKFAYDIWGEAVNLASRAESHGLLNEVNLTEYTYQKVKDRFDCEYRGMVDVKNIGQIKMFTVKQITR